MTRSKGGSAEGIVVVGAGAAGLLAALFAARAGARTTLLESTRDGGRKILISGGGRCNILPERFEPERFTTDSSPHTLKIILRSWPLDEQRRFFERELGMGLVLEKESGKWFPETHRAKDVRDRLVARVREAGVRLLFGRKVTGLDPAAAGWHVRLEDGDGIETAAVILATGGCSVPKTGSDGTGLELARALGHTIHPTYPALTPLTADPPVHGHLSGVSLPVTIRAPGARPRLATTGGFLFTHRGYSGPATLDISHRAARSLSDGGIRQPLLVQWTPRDREAWETSIRTGGVPVGRIVAAEMPQRLARQLMNEAGVDFDLPAGALPRPIRRRLLALLTEYPLPWSGTEGYAKAEVTGGGIPLSEIDRKTMESRRRSGLFLCGEILDAFGPIGGHNFLWAWTTGRTAGLGAAAAAACG